MNNTETLREFLVEREANEISERTRDLDIMVIKKLDGFLKKPFRQATKEDMIHFITYLNEQGYKPNSLHTVKRKVKLFYNWLFKLEPRIYPDCVRWMHSSNPRSNTKSGGMELPIKPKDILTQQEILQLVNAATHPRDQCMVMLTYETAGRAEEILKLKIGSIQFSERVGYVTLEGNTGARRIPIVLSVPYVQTWLNVHPAKHNPEAYLFPPMKGKSKRERIEYHNFLKLMGKLKRDSKIQKPVRPHLLRHARLTELAKHLTDAQLKTYAGWTQGSTMTGVYVHLAGEDLDRPILEMHGLAMKEKPVETPLKPKICVRGHENSPTAEYCMHCGIILDSDKALELMEKEAIKERESKEIEELKANMIKLQPLLEFANMFKDEKSLMAFVEDSLYAKFVTGTTELLEELIKKHGVTNKNEFIISMFKKLVEEKYGKSVKELAEEKRKKTQTS